ncbi:MAG: pantetheine-phosphate adenylyltransferase [Bacteroidales bacterium]
MATESISPFENSRIAVFPGSFDPLTAGHYGIVLRALGFFDKIIIAIGHNTDKKAFFPAETRLQMIRDIFRDKPRVECEIFSGLTVNFCRQKGARFILRGLRTSADFEFERVVAHVNRKLYPDIETIFLLTAPEHSFISSSIVREVLSHGGDPTPFLPPHLELNKYLKPN